MLENVYEGLNAGNENKKYKSFPKIKKQKYKSFPKIKKHKMFPKIQIIFQKKKSSKIPNFFKNLNCFQKSTALLGPSAGLVSGSNGPFGHPRGSLRALIWSQLPPIGPSGSFEAKSIPFCGGYRLEGNRSPQSAGP